MTKQGVKGKYQRTLHEKYETHLNCMRKVINTNIHTIKSTNHNKVQVICYHLDLGEFHFIVIHYVHKQCLKLMFSILKCLYNTQDKTCQSKHNNVMCVIIMYYIRRATCFDSTESSSGPQGSDQYTN